MTDISQKSGILTFTMHKRGRKMIKEPYLYHEHDCLTLNTYLWSQKCLHEHHLVLKRTNGPHRVTSNRKGPSLIAIICTHTHKQCSNVHPQGRSISCCCRASCTLRQIDHREGAGREKEEAVWCLDISIKTFQKSLVLNRWVLSFKFWKCCVLVFPLMLFTSQTNF